MVNIFTRCKVWVGECFTSLRVRLKIPYILHAEVIHKSSKPRATYVFIHGIGNTLHSWDDVYTLLPDDVRVIGIDLLGFGGSPKPRRVVYDVRIQARSVMRTLTRLGLTARPVIVGHSLGSLVAIEMARRYPLLLKHIVLCSPPLYGREGAVPARSAPRERLLRELYSTVRRYPGQLEKILPLAAKAGFASKSLYLTNEVIEAYVASLEASIINQSAVHDLGRLNIPVTIFYGAFDPLVIGSRIKEAAAPLSKATIYKVRSGHEVVGGYAGRVAEFLKSLL